MSPWRKGATIGSGEVAKKGKVVLVKLARFAPPKESHLMGRRRTDEEERKETKSRNFVKGERHANQIKVGGGDDL